MTVRTMLDAIPGIPLQEGPVHKARLVAKLLAQDGHVISEQAIRKWGARDAIPSKWLVRIAKASKTLNPMDHLT